MAKSNFIIHRTSCKYANLPKGSLYALCSRSRVIRRRGSSFDNIVEILGEACFYQSSCSWLCPDSDVFPVSPRYR